MKDVEAYFAAIAEPRLSRIKALHNLIVGLFPAATVDMKYKMPTYQLGEGWVAIANQKQYVSLYTCGAHHLVAFKKKYPNIETGKGCINFADKVELPLESIEAVVTHAIKHPKG